MFSKYFHSYFHKPKPSQEIVQHFTDRLRRELLEALSHKITEQTISMEFRHDVFKHIFNGKGEKRKGDRNWMIYREEDFSRCKFPSGWNSMYDKHGDGVKIMFPLKMRTFLSLSPKGFCNIGGSIKEMPRFYTEKISIKFVRITDSCTNKVSNLNINLG